MGYLEKQNQMLQRLQDTNYAAFGGPGKKDMILGAIERATVSFADYVNIVVRQQIMTPIWQAKCEPEEYRENIQNIDSSRHITHDAVIVNVDMLNTISKRIGLPAFAEIDTNNRQAVANLAGEYVNEVFNKGIGNTMDSAAYGRKAEYDTAVIRDHIRRPLPSVPDETPEPDQNSGEFGS